MTAPPFSRPTLERAVSRWELVGLTVNGVVGSGIYLLPAAAAAMLGAASLWAILLAGLAISLIVLCFVEASSYFDRPGGAYLFTREAFGDFVGFEVGWMTWLSRIAAAASLANGFALAVAYLWPAAAGGWVNGAVVAAPLLLVTVLNLIGVRIGAHTSTVLVILKILPLLLFVGLGLFFVDWSRATDFRMPDSSIMGQAALLLLFAYAGFENAPAAAGEYKRPRRDAPFALLATILFATLLYVLVQVVALGTFPGLAASNSPLAEAAELFMGGWGALLLAVGAAVAVAGTLSSALFFAPRYLFALSVDGYGPRRLSAVHPRFHTPHAAIVAGAAVALVLALSGTFVQLAMLSVIARLATYAGTAAAVPFLRRRFGTHPQAVLLPGGPSIPLLALLVTLAFVASTSFMNLVAGGAALLAGAVIYRLRRAPEPAASVPAGTTQEP